MMFIIYINDIPDVLRQSDALMYADDTVLYSSSICTKEVRKKLQSDLVNVEKWCLKNRLSLNVSKTKIMTFMSDHKRKTLPQLRFFMKGTQVEEVDTYKYLGTHLDNRLSGDVQFTKTNQTLGFKIRTFSRIRRFVNTKAALTIYKSTILPIIDYNNYFQMMWNVDKRHRLQKLQNWGLRIVYNYFNNGPKLNEEEMHNEANLDLLSHRRILHMLNLMFHRSKQGVYLDKRDIHTRQFDKVKFKVITLVIKKAFACPNYLGSKLWDLLPNETQTELMFKTFKYKVKRHIAAGLFNAIQ